MKYYLIAGEASGDLHGANLMAALKKEDPGASFRYFGGDKMKAEGGELVLHISGMAFMGFVEVITNLNTIAKNLKLAKKDLLAYQPDVLILVDFPGFNLQVAGFAKAHKIPVFYYISPKVWAWNQKRVLRIKRLVDRMFCILPFEVDFYRKWGMEVDYIGNPLLDAIASHVPQQNFREENKLEGHPVIALLPGSRKQEISRILPDMIGAARQFPGYRPVIAGAPNFNREYYLQYMGDASIPVVFDHTYDLLSHAECALVTSGTATLETALLKVPQVVVYKGNSLTIGIARFLIRTRFISLVNLIMDREVVKELIQGDCNPSAIAAEMKKLLKNEPSRIKMLAEYKELANLMGKPGASAHAATLMAQYLAK
ncbi:lipid-A-disaccharide synthase [Hufsiella ginkgonis]|uniref:Lipid-A-disaccharide synthase n=1 Tax=Hufsiella ginkgonis TaxID=2695274 RepID=A0A7K1Y1M9_9SPHI|nr:lipid-A-disaccharide synthase [Hufsiella ginkgonis]MXV16988.1 lipid-A-disaccharide synthase [Hufsiella ginkgonis]